MSVGAKIGRPHKGPREVVKFRMNPTQKRAAVERAHALGMTLTDYITSVVSRDTGVALTQEGLPYDAVA